MARGTLTHHPFGKFAEAEQLFLQSVAIDRKDNAADHDDFAYSFNSLGIAEIGLGRIRQAFAAHRRSAPDPPMRG